MGQGGRDADGLDPRRVAPEGKYTRPRLYLVGEAPGAEEAERGRPFVGPAGQALCRMLDDAGVDAGEIRLANAVPFRPIERGSRGTHRNRRPNAAEIEDQGRAVLTDIKRSKPAAIIALGRTAARLFGERRPLAEARSEPATFDGRPLLFTYHPAYVRRFGGPDSELWRQTVGDLRRAWRMAPR